MIRIRTNLAPRWNRQIREATTPLTVLSPYITENSTLKLLANKQATFYTRFEVRDFVCMASTIAAFKLLLINKCTIYEVKDLHAKVIMDEADFVTLGSQNLTFRGASKNKELSVCFDNSKANSCERVRSVVNDWIDDPDLELIDWARVLRMEKDVRLAKKAFEEFNEAMSKIQGKADTYQAKRVQVARDQQEQERAARKAKNLAAIGAAVRSGAPSGTKYAGTVKPSEGSARLKFDAKVDLLQWTRKNGIDLPRMIKSSRCLCVLNQQKVGWARLASQQITKFAQSMTIGGILPKPFDRVDVTLSVTPKDLARAPSDTTLVAILKNENGTELCMVPVLYSIDEISVLDTLGPKRKPSGKKLKPIEQLRTDLKRWIDSNRADFESLLSRHITSTTPLKKRLDGVNADVFFEGMDTVVDVTMVFKGRNGTKPILVATTRS